MHVVTELGARPCTLCVPQPFGEFLHDSLKKKKIHKFAGNAPKMAARALT